MPRIAKKATGRRKTTTTGRKKVKATKAKRSYVRKAA